MRSKHFCRSINKRNNIQGTLESIFNQTRTPNHVVVIDDHSDDGSAKVIEDLKYKLTLLKFEKNVGKANAINEGLKYVDDPFIKTRAIFHSISN